MKNWIILIIPVLILIEANAVMITFSGGTIHLWNGTTAISTDTDLYNHVQYYEESGIRFEYIAAANDSWTLIGNYYNIGWAVIHGHWQPGAKGSKMTAIKITKINGSPFDMTYFKVTSNAGFPGGAASGNEVVYINALKDGSTVSYS